MFFQFSKLKHWMVHSVTYEWYSIVEAQTTKKISKSWFKPWSIVLLSLISVCMWPQAIAKPLKSGAYLDLSCYGKSTNQTYHYIFCLFIVTVDPKSLKNQPQTFSFIPGNLPWQLVIRNSHLHWVVGVHYYSAEGHRFEPQSDFYSMP